MFSAIRLSSGVSAITVALAFGMCLQLKSYLIKDRENIIED